MTIFVPDEIREIVYSIIGRDTNVRVLPIGFELPFTMDKFNTWLCSARFWEIFTCERILFFRTDTGIRYNDALRFMKYDCIGAPWHHYPTGDPRVWQGNGAFAIRNPRIMTHICRNFTNFPIIPEDVFFSAHVVNIPGICLPIRSEAIKFSYEGTLYPDTFGFHNASELWPGYEGPSRSLFKLESATVDGRDVSDFVRIGIGAKCLRIGQGTFFGGKTLAINGQVFELHDGCVQHTIELPTIKLDI